MIWPPHRTLAARFGIRAAMLTLIITLALGAIAGSFLYLQVRRAIEDGVQAHLNALEAELDLAPLSFAGEQPPLVLPSPEQSVQVLTLDGQVVASSSDLVDAIPLVDAAGMPPNESVTTVVMINNSDGDAIETLAVARVIEADGERYVGIVGASLERLDAIRFEVALAIAIGAPLLAVLLGLTVWFAVTRALRPVTDMAARADRIAAGTHTWRLGVRPDTRELRILAENLDDLLSQLKATFERERRFLDDASHELRTPIAIARTELELAEAEPSPPAVSEAVASSLEELDRIDRLADDLLLLARTRRPDHAPFAECNLSGVARAAAASVLRSGTSHDVALTVRGHATAVGDKDSLERAMTNVIANAVRHSRGRVDVVLAMEGGDSIVEISDDGPGFPDDLIDAAFERFSRSPEQRSSGSGLGLAISAAIVAAHGGTITAANAAEGGAVVTIRLPRSGPAGSAQLHRVRRGIPKEPVRSYHSAGD